MDKKQHQEIVNDDSLTASKKIEAVFAGLPPETDDQKAAREDELDDRFYEDNADNIVLDFGRLLREFERSAKEQYGEDSAEFQTLKAEIVPVKAKVREYKDHISHPDVKKALRPLHEIWREYRGWDQDGKGGLQQRTKEPDRAILSSFHARASFDLRS